MKIFFSARISSVKLIQETGLQTGQTESCVENNFAERNDMTNPKLNIAYCQVATWLDLISDLLRSILERNSQSCKRTVKPVLPEMMIQKSEDIFFCDSLYPFVRYSNLSRSRLLLQSEHTKTAAATAAATTTTTTHTNQ